MFLNTEGLGANPSGYLLTRGLGSYGGGGTDPVSLFDALHDLLDADATLEAAFGGDDWLWIDLGPPGISLPYAVLGDVVGESEADSTPAASDPEFLNIVQFDLTVFASTRASARSLARRVARAIERADHAGSIDYSEAEHMYCRRSGDGIDALDDEPGPAGASVFSHMIQFKAISTGSDS